MRPFTIIRADCREAMRDMEPESVDAIATDPPYGLKFMGKGWDHGVPGVEFWIEALRVLKPGGHLLAFGGTRTFHRLTCGLEDAGFEIRDCLSWMYGQGFPKSMDVSKAIDKAAGKKPIDTGIRSARHGGGIVGAGTSYEVSPAVPNITAPATPEAEQWQGWGTALKPAWEPIILARKPLVTTVAANVLEHGTGALNIDGCRIDGTPWSFTHSDKTSRSSGLMGKTSGAREGVAESHPGGRWPANVLLDVDAAAVLDEQTGTLKSGKDNVRRKPHETAAMAGILGPLGREEVSYGDAGGASRFFYCAKVSKRERNLGLPEGMRNTHPTCKPVAVMAWLCRLITPLGGLVLDPFMGSGSTGVAALNEGFRFIGVEIDDEGIYCEIARHRLDHALKEKEDHGRLT